MAMRTDGSTGQMVEAPESDAELVAAVDPKKPTMQIKIYAPFKVYFEGDGYSVTAVNETGPFDILPRHHNFICMLVACNVVVQTSYGEKVIQVSRALMHVKADRVVIFVDV